MKLSFFVMAALFAAGANAQSFINGGFDGNANGWTVNAAFGGYQGSTGQSGAPGWVWLNSGGGVDIPHAEQTVSGLTIGETYRVTFWMGSGQIFNAGDVFQALVDGTVVFNGPNNQVVGWNEFSYDYTATATSHLFRFQSEVIADSDYVLDTVSIATSPVPEPATMTVLGLALAGFLARRRKS